MSSTSSADLAAEELLFATQLQGLAGQDGLEGHDPPDQQHRAANRDRVEHRRDKSLSPDARPAQRRRLTGPGIDPPDPARPQTRRAAEDPDEPDADREQAEPADFKPDDEQQQEQQQQQNAPRHRWVLHNVQMSRAEAARAASRPGLFRGHLAAQAVPDLWQTSCTGMHDVHRVQRAAVVGHAISVSIPMLTCMYASHLQMGTGTTCKLRSALMLMDSLSTVCHTQMAMP